MTTILLQPHPDDLAYSLGGALIRKSFGNKILAVTVFSESVSAKVKSSQLPISFTRQKEDRKFFKKLGIKYKDLKLADSSVRPIEYTLSYLGLIESALRKIVKKNDYIICPMAIGYHIDHLLVKEACDIFDKSRILYYEDIPYVFRYGSYNTLTKTMHKTSLDVGKSMDKKIENLLIYESQIDDITLEQVRKKYSEVLWYE